MTPPGVMLLIVLAVAGCASRADNEIISLRSRVARLSEQAASGGGVNLKMMPDPGTGAMTVPMEEVFSFDRYHAICRVDSNPQAFKMPTHRMGEVTVAAHTFFMAMSASTIDQFTIETLPNGHRKVTMRGNLGCATEIKQGAGTIGSRSVPEDATYMIEAVDAGFGGGAAGDSFAFTAFFDPDKAPINYKIFGPRFTFTGQMTQGEITIAPVAGAGTPKTEHAAETEVAVAWFNLLYDVVKQEAYSPAVASRIYGFTGVALYEAVVPGSPEHRSLASQLNGLSSMPQPKPHLKHHWPTVANAAVSRLLGHLLSGASARSMTAIAALEARFAHEFRDELPPLEFARSVEQGRAVADALLTWAAGDGFTKFNNCPFTPPVRPGLWVPTPPTFARNPLQPCWGELRPFVLTSGATCAPPPPTTYTVAPNSSFDTIAREVRDTGNSLSSEQQTVALYWADGPGATGTPPGHWTAIVAQVAQRDDLPLATAAEAFARVGIAVADAFIACWNTKYTYNLLRPVTYIRNVIDPLWSPFLVTPEFPEYTSGHSVQSSAAATVLTDMFGVKAFIDTTHVDHGLVPAPAPRSFASFAEAAREAGISRLYGGIHFRPAIERGFEQGACVGKKILDHVRFRR